MILLFSLRALYGENTLKNAVHGSSDPEHAKKTMELIFGGISFNIDGSMMEESGTKPLVIHIQNYMYKGWNKFYMIVSSFQHVFEHVTEIN